MLQVEAAKTSATASCAPQEKRASARPGAFDEVFASIRKDATTQRATRDPENREPQKSVRGTASGGNQPAAAEKPRKDAPEEGSPEEQVPANAEAPVEQPQDGPAAAPGGAEVQMPAGQQPQEVDPPHVTPGEAEIDVPAEMHRPGAKRAAPSVETAGVVTGEPGGMTQTEPAVAPVGTARETAAAPPHREVAGGVQSAAVRAMTSVAVIETQPDEATGADPVAVMRVEQSGGDGASFQEVLGSHVRTRPAARMDAQPSSPTDAVVHANEPRASGELGQVLRAAGGSGRSNLLLQLDPPELGRVRVNVQMHEQTLTVRFEAHTQAGADAIQSRLSELRSTLESQGLSVARFDVELRPPPSMQPQDGQPQQYAWSQGGGSGGQMHWGDDGRSASGSSREGSFGFSSGGSAEGPVEAAMRPAESGVDLVV